jgi:hypothetical protein
MKSKLPSQEQRNRRARILLRALWQGYDAAGHSCGRSRTCGLLETAMSLMGPPDASESSRADTDIGPLVQEARDWLREISVASAEEHYLRLDAGTSAVTRQIAAEIESGFEDRMR